jgi:hypothetical protein
MDKVYKWGLTFALFLVLDKAEARTYLVDFGTASSYRGVTTPSPDSNGNYWNGLELSTNAILLRDSSNVTGSIRLGFVTTSGVGTDSYNGPAGPTDATNLAANLLLTDLDTAALGSLGSREAGFDYVVSSNGRLVLSGLDPAVTYQLTLFGSHKYSTDTSTSYEVYRNSSLTQSAGSASLNVQSPTSPAQHNRNQVAVIPNLTPSSAGTLYLRFRGGNGSVGYLNALMLSDATTTSNTPTFLSSSPIYFRIRNQSNSCYLETAADGTPRMTSTDPGSSASGQWFLQGTTNTNLSWIVNRSSGTALRGPVGTGAITSSLPDAADTRQAFLRETNGGSLRFVDAGGSNALTGVANGATPTMTARDVAASSQLWTTSPVVNGMQVPWVSYDEDNCQPLVSPSSKITSAYSEGATSIAAEAQKRGCILLNGSGAFAKWTATDSANMLCLRYSVADDSSGTVTLRVTGTNGTITSQKVSLTSAQAWVYFDSQMNEYNSAGTGRVPLKRYNETRIKLATSLQPGDTLELRRDSGDNLAVWIDVLEAETSSSFTPTNLATAYLDVTGYGANGSDNGDDTSAFQSCLNAATTAGKGVYIPPGTYRINQQLNLLPNTTLQGAGMWHTEILFTSTGSEASGGIEGRGANIKLRDFYLKGSQESRYSAPSGYKAIKGWFSTNSLIENVWAEQTTCGVWAGWYNSGQTNNFTHGTTIRNCRFRNTFADGINLAQGSRYSTVENCHIRGNGDDGLASWSSGLSGGWPQCQSLIFRYNTIECVWRAGGIGIFGGQAHVIQNNLIRDQVAGAGIRLNTVFHQDAHPFGPSILQIFNNTLERTGSLDGYGDQTGAIDLQTWYADLKDLDIHNNTVDNSRYAAVRFSNIGGIPGVDFLNISLTSITVQQVPVGILVKEGSTGTTEVDSALAANISNLAGTGFNLTIAAANPPVILSFTPSSAAPGTTVTVTGTDLAGASSVSVGGTPATSFANSDNQTVTLVVPQGAPSGTVRITTPGGTTFSSATLTVLAANTAPVVTPVSPPGLTVPLGTGVILKATATDDGLPTSSLTRLWSVVSSPTGARPALESPSSSNTPVRFDQTGLYLFRHTVSDGSLSDSTEIAVSYGTNPVATGADLGTVGVSGSASQTNGVWTVQGSGTDIWGTEDGGHFLAAPLAGDGFLQARFLSQGNTDPWAKVGLMIRNSRDRNSAHTFLAITPANGLALQHRPTAGDVSFHTNVGSSTFPLWLRLERSGTNIVARRSSNGTNWVTLGSVNPLLNSNCLIGVAISSHQNGLLSTASLERLEGSAFASKAGPQVSAGTNRIAVTNAPSTLTGTVLPSSGVALSWSLVAGPGTLSFGTPTNTTTSATGALPGEYQVRLQAGDGTLETFADLLLTLTNAFGVWQTQNFAGLSTAEGLPLADPDGDGWVNLLEFAQGSSPTSSSGSQVGMGLQVTTNSGSTNGPTFSFRRRSGSGSGSTESGYTVDGITYTLRTSVSLGSPNWQTGPAVIQQVGSPVNHGDGTETVTVRLFGTNPASFLKMEVSSP